MLNILIFISIAAFIFLSFYRVTYEKTTHKYQATTLPRPLTDLECDYMLTLPLMGVAIPAEQTISAAHEALLDIGMVEETYNKQATTRTIHFTEEGNKLARMMRENM
ncbi:MAG: hypothetical protein ACI9TY_000781 [Alphaproteobacteria bacterium]|jgi:hypothetical protein